MPPPVQVDIEYCLICGLREKCEELQKVIQVAAPNAKVNCVKGPKGAFEIKINDHLIYSKIKQKTFPEFTDVTENVINASESKPLKPVRATKDECSIM